MNKIGERRVNNKVRVPAVESCILQMKDPRSYIELRAQIMRNGIEGLEAEVSVPVADAPRILRLRRIESRLKIQIVQVGIHHALLVVVIELAIIDKSVADAQIKDAG